METLPRESWDVVIAGAGPVGLALALGLAQRGISVLVCEKDEGLHEHSRAPILWPRTQEFLAELHVLEAIEQEAVVTKTLPFRFHGYVNRDLTLDLADIAGETPFPQVVLLPQNEIERVLHDHLKAFEHAQICFGHKVVDATTRDRQVEVVCERQGGAKQVLTGRMLVGCDGAHSDVRKAVGTHLSGLTYDLEAALADIRVEHQSLQRFPLVQVGKDVAVALPLGKGRWRYILPGKTDDVARRVELASRRLFGHEGPFPVTWYSHFRLHRRLCDRWVRGRMVLAGDAAHLNSPVGGQGMNAGLQDAQWLLPAIEQVLKSGDLRFLDHYQNKRRHAIGSGVNRLTHRLTVILQSLLQRPRLLAMVVEVLVVATRWKPVRVRMLRNICMLNVERPSF